MKKTYTFIIAILIISCGEGYKKENEKWTWFKQSEAGNHIREITPDMDTFEILKNEEYAKDKNTVYRKGLVIANADPKTFTVISEDGYSKDKNNVYIDNETIIFADPKTFEIIKWPYSKDKKRIYNGNLPMEVNNFQEFNVNKSNGMKTSTTKSFFIKLNQEYKWLDTINVKTIIVGEYSEAKTITEKFKGFRKIE